MLRMKLAVLAAVSVALFGWGCSAQETVEEPAGPNTLTAAEREAGWQLLFDGQTTDGWRGYNQEGFPDHGWEVQDGELVVLEDGGGGDIITVETFENYELSVDFKMSPRSNGGIFLGVVEEEGVEIWKSAPEYQLLDDAAFLEDGRDLSTHLTGHDYDVRGSDSTAMRAAGEWNTAKIVVDGTHVEHWLNGTKMLEYERWTPEWEEKVAASKFNEYPQYGRAQSGHIGLQDHGYLMWFRNIKIRPIE